MPHPDRTMHASMREVEPGLFNAEYPGAFKPLDSDRARIPDSHNGTDPQAVKTWVETMARELGFTDVVWDELPAQLIEGR